MRQKDIKHKKTRHKYVTQIHKAQTKIQKEDMKAEHENKDTKTWEEDI